MTDRFHFSLGGTRIPSVSEKPIKSLGKTFDYTLRVVASIKSTTRDLVGWLTAAEVKTTRLIQSLDILSWYPAQDSVAIVVYEFPMSTVAGLERKISCHLCRWLGLPQSLSSIAIYSKKN